VSRYFLSKRFFLRVLLPIVGVLALLVAGAPAFLDWSLRDREIARVAVPESTLVVVLIKDFKQLGSYQIWENGRPISGRRLMGRVYGNEHAVRVTRSERGIMINWGDRENPYIELDPKRRVVIRDSNGAGHPAQIEAAP
jgi:hypothetical protein